MLPVVRLLLQEESSSMDDRKWMGWLDWCKSTVGQVDDDDDNVVVVDGE